MTAAYGIEAAARLRDCAAAGFRSAVTEPQLDHAPARPVQPTGQCNQGSCPVNVQVSIQTRKGPLGLCAHHYDTNFAALVLAGCDRTKHIGNLTPPVDRNPSSASSKK